MTSSFLDSNKIIVCAGTGGVGKTTLSACLGIFAAKRGRRVLVLTIDPARRLADALGISAQTDQEMKIDLKETSGSLTAVMVNPSFIFDRFIERAARSPERAQRILKNNLYKQMATTLSGSQEFTSLEKLSLSLESGLYDLVILDTPPAHHAVDFLYAPQKIYSLFQNSISQWFIKKEGSIGLLQELFSRGTKTALAALEKITGSYFITELSDFFEGMAEIQNEVCTRSIAIHRLLTGPECAFLLITGFDRANLDATEYFVSELRKGGYSLHSVIINRCYPKWSPSDQTKSDPRFQPIIDFHRKLSFFNQQKEIELEKFNRTLGSSTAVVRIPDLIADITGIDGLVRLANLMEPYLKGSIK